MADRRHPPYGEKLHPARRATPWIYNAWPGNCRETLPSLSDILLDNATIIANLSFSLPLRPFFSHVCFCREAVETNISFDPNLLAFARVLCFFVRSILSSSLLSFLFRIFSNAAGLPAIAEYVLRDSIVRTCNWKSTAEIATRASLPDRKMEKS